MEKFVGVGKEFSLFIVMEKVLVGEKESVRGIGVILGVRF